MGRVECRRGAELPAAPCGGIYGRRPLHRDTKLPCLAALQPGELRMSRRSWGRNRCRPPSCLSMPVRSCLCARCQEVDARRQNCLLLWHACRLEHGSMWSAEISGYFSCQGMFGRTHSFWVQMITCYAVCKIAGLNACAISQQWAAVAEIGGCRYYLTHHSLYLTLPDRPSSIQGGLTPLRRHFVSAQRLFRDIHSPPTPQQQQALSKNRPIYISAFIISLAADNTTKLNLGCPNYSYYPVRLNNGMRPAPTPCLLIQASGENAACPANGWINDHLQQPNSVWQKLLKRSKGFCRKFWPGSFYGPRRDVIQYHF